MHSPSVVIRTFAAAMAVLLLVPDSLAEEARWETDWKEAFRIAKRERKLVFVDFYADWCKPCRMMEEEVFPTPEVQARLREYVLLRVDVDRPPAGLKSRPRALPTYIIYDCDERDRFQFYGGMPAKAFLTRLDLIRGGMPFMLHAADLFTQKQDVEAWMQVAKGYKNVGAAEQSREAWQRAQRAAGSRGDPVTAEIAAINGALTWAMEGKAAKAVDLLKKITRSPVNNETEGLGWFVLGEAYVAMKDATRAREAFETAKTRVAPDHPVAKQANAALARLR